MIFTETAADRVQELIVEQKETNDIGSILDENNIL